MRVLLLSQFFPPEEPSGRAYDLATELVARGHRATVVTGFPNYPLGRTYPGYRQRPWLRERCGEVEVVRLPIYPDHSLSKARRALNFLSFAVSASLLGPLLSGPADVLWVYSPPPTIGVAACALAAVRRLPIVYEIQDMWPDTVISTGLMKAGRATRLIDGFLRSMYRRAAAVSVISPGFKRHLIAKGVPTEKIHVLPNWTDELIYRPTPRDAEFGRKHELTGCKNIIFAGNQGPAQGLESLIEAAALLCDDPSIRITIVGDGIANAALREQVRRLNLANVRFVGKQPVSAMPDFYAWADGLLVQLRDDPLFEITLPSKCLAYMACGRPIIAALSGDGADQVREARAGLVCHPGDAGALAATIRELLALPVERRERFGLSGRKAYEANFARSSVVDRYETLFAQLAGLAPGERTLEPQRIAA